jgi:hypothetical protein
MSSLPAIFILIDIVKPCHAVCVTDAIRYTGLGKAIVGNEMWRTHPDRASAILPIRVDLSWLQCRRCAERAVSPERPTVDQDG